MFHPLPLPTGRPRVMEADETFNLSSEEPPPLASTCSPLVTETKDTNKKEISDFGNFNSMQFNFIEIHCNSFSGFFKID